MNINHRLIKHYLRNVRFITGTAYAGKSTMAKMLSEAYGLIHCGENYDCIPPGILNPEQYPNLSYFETMKDWQEFIHRPPELYEKWIFGSKQELAEFEITYLIHISKSQIVIVDTNIPVDILQKIADYNQVAVMLSPQSMSVEKFFDRQDPDKVFIKEQIMKSDHPEKSMAHFLSCIGRVNSKKHYDDLANSGFLTVLRDDSETDTKSDVLALLARHFGLSESTPLKT